MLEVKIGELNKDNVFVQHFVIWSSISHSKPTSARHYNYFHKTSYKVAVGQSANSSNPNRRGWVISNPGSAETINHLFLD